MLGFIAIITSERQTQTASPVNVPVVKSAEDEAALVVTYCGQPDHDFLEKAPGTTIRHLVYKRFKTELFFYRDANTPKWILGNAFVPAKDEEMSMDEANRRIPCAKGKLHSFLCASGPT